jgi:hypothetical protein
LAAGRWAQSQNIDTVFYGRDITHSPKEMGKLSNRDKTQSINAKGDLSKRDKTHSPTERQKSSNSVKGAAP